MNNNNTSRSNDETVRSSGQDSFGKPDAEYYFNIVVFKVENTLFRVPRNGFDVPGTIFETMFSLPVEGDNIQGSSDSNPIVLPVSEESFRGFLRAMYGINGHQMTDTDWLGALDLSMMWMFNDIRRRAVQALDNWIKKRNAKEAVLLAKKYRMTNWLTDAYTRILQQKTLTMNELGASPFSLDWETIARLLSAREDIRVINLHNSGQHCACACCNRTRSYSGTSCGCKTILQANAHSPTSANLKMLIETTFKGEISRMNEEYHS